MNIRPILNIRPKYSPFRAFHVAVGSGCTIKHFSLACPTQHTIPSQYRPGALVYWPLAAKGMPTKLTCTHSYRVHQTSNGTGDYVSCVCLTPTSRTGSSCGSGGESEDSIALYASARTK